MFSIAQFIYCFILSYRLAEIGHGGVPSIHEYTVCSLSMLCHSHRVETVAQRHLLDTREDLFFYPLPGVTETIPSLSTKMRTRFVR